MFQIHSIAGRILIGKSIGFVVGALVFFFMPTLEVSNDLYFRFGLWTFYTLLGVVVALAGVLTIHPIGFPLKWWLRGAVMGALMHFMIILLAFEEFSALIAHPMFSWMGVVSPFWLILDGMVLGVIMGYTATKIAGEGSLPMR